MRDKVAMEDKNYNAGQSREAVILKTATTVCHPDILRQLTSSSSQCSMKYWQSAKKISLYGHFCNSANKRLGKNNGT